MHGDCNWVRLLMLRRESDVGWYRVYPKSSRSSQRGTSGRSDGGMIARTRSTGAVHAMESSAAPEGSVPGCQSMRNASLWERGLPTRCLRAMVSRTLDRLYVFLVDIVDVEQRVLYLS